LLDGRLLDSLCIKSCGVLREKLQPGTMHEMAIRMVVTMLSPDAEDSRKKFLKIKKIEVKVNKSPYPECCESRIAEGYKKMEGISFYRGFSKSLKEKVGGPDSCTHLTTLLSDMAIIAWQAYFFLHSEKITTQEYIGDILQNFENSCLTWRKEGQIFKKMKKTFNFK